MGFLAGGSARSLAALLLVAALAAPMVAPTVVEAKRGEPRQRGAGVERAALIVKLKPGTSDAAVAALGLASGATEIGRIDEIDARVLRVTGRDRAKVRRALLSSPAVTAVEDDGAVKATGVPTDPLWSKQWYARRVRGPAAWDVTTGKGGPIVAVLDTGVQANHPDLRGRVLSGWNFVGNNANAGDDGDHGTPVAGVIAAAGNNGVGVAGMCWQCRILPVKVLNAAGSGSWSNVAAGVIWAANNGASVINLSLGGASGSAALRDAVAYAVSKGVVVVAAAGNSSSTSKFYPAAYPGVISVAGTTSADTIYSFSNRGSWVRIAAPGCTHSTSVGSKWRSFCGTSAATPVVAGVAALVLSRVPNASRSKVTGALLSTSVPIGTVIGGGRLDAASAVRSLGAPALDPDPTPKPSPAPSATPKPSPAPSATPKPSPAPSATPKPGIPREGEVGWQLTLDSANPKSQRSFGLRGEVEIDVEWQGAPLKGALFNDKGSPVAWLNTKTWCSDGDGCGGRGWLDKWLPAGVYTLWLGLAEGGSARAWVEVDWDDD